MSCPLGYGSPAKRMHEAAGGGVCPLGYGSPMKRKRRDGGVDSGGGVCPLGHGSPVAQPPAKRARADCYYGDYLRVGRLLTCQEPRSGVKGDSSKPPAHDELLFIITHQAYELWFKQILHELWWVHRALGAQTVQEMDHVRVVQRLTRVVKIMKLLLAQFEVLETMTPMDFMEFRSELEGASGFQSVQFRTIEALLGVPENSGRKESLRERMQELDMVRIECAREIPSLLDRVGSWLERVPGLDGEFDLSSKFEAVTKAALAKRRSEILAEGTRRSREATQNLLAECAQRERAYQSIFDEGAHALLLREGKRRLSRRAMMGAILIRSYRTQPRFHIPDQIIERLMDIDELMMKWRNDHVLMVHRMIGFKTGTGGSSGHAYLRSTLGEEHRAFKDLFDLTGFLIPAHQLPPVTEGFAALMHSVPYRYEDINARMVSDSSTDEEVGQGQESSGVEKDIEEKRERS